MIPIIYSGGQTGVDQAAWRAAKKCGLQTAGCMTAGFMTENGPRPEFKDLYNAAESRSPNYATRTYRNAQETDATLWLGPTGSPGFLCTWNACKNHPHHSIKKRPFSQYPDFWTRTNTTYLMTPARDWSSQFYRLNIAGTRESKSPGIGQLAEEFLTELFSMILQEHQKPQGSI